MKPENNRNIEIGGICMRKTAVAAVIASAVVITLGGTTALAFGHSGQNGYHHAASVSCDGTGHHAGHSYGHR